MMLGGERGDGGVKKCFLSLRLTALLSAKGKKDSGLCTAFCKQDSTASGQKATPNRGYGINHASKVKRRGDGKEEKPSDRRADMEE
jgi:hypothetical protein